MTQTAEWPFETDADRNDPLTAHRIAVTSSHPRWYYLVAFDSESEARPTDAETAMLASFLNEYKDHWYGNSGFRQKMEQRALDVDGGANGVIFHKWGEDDWGFRRHSYEYGYLFSIVWPSQRADKEPGKYVGPYSLVGLMDLIHTIGDERPMQRWLDWKATHPEVFA
ncbi:hypothetical protein ABT369_39580 [Dactylosporangium sp. NPDC000244]|uniref:hypothetical protein n=1 Tax=Dactylosporangium sp. NPDC000244 TaxID=3154365 RepID=UPI00331C8E41